jgi:hypothetical protein
MSAEEEDTPLDFDSISAKFNDCFKDEHQKNDFSNWVGSGIKFNELTPVIAKYIQDNFPYTSGSEMWDWELTYQIEISSPFTNK